MSDTFFDCAVCGHSVIKHNVTVWPHIAKRCPDCDCTGYTPEYRKGDNA